MEREWGNTEEWAPNRPQLWYLTGSVSDEFRIREVQNQRGPSSDRFRIR
jgi:outer membrane lipoprotein-sorting protein